MNTITPRLEVKSKRLKNTVPPHLHKNPNVSFKGNPDIITRQVKTLITEADKPLMDIFSTHYGDIGTRIGRKLGRLASETISENSQQGIGLLEKAGNKLLQKSSRFSMEKGALSIKSKSIPRSLVENIIFPFVNLPLYGLNWVVSKAKSVPALKKGAEKVYRTPLLRVPRKLHELDWKTDSLKGIMERTKDTVTDFAKNHNLTYEEVMQKIAQKNPDDAPLLNEANDYIKESLYKVSNKFFDKHTGNFNTAYERPLNRIVTGLIPVAFLANDAYNLSVLCGDKKEDSVKEANERKRQEISRVFTTAFIQLLTFGAFTKQVNTIPWFTPLTSAATVLFSEINSRKKNGKPIFFLTPEQAKEHNIKKANKETSKKTFKIPFGKNNTSQDKQKTTAQQGNIQNSSQKFPVKVVSQNTPNVFTSFKASNNNTEKPDNEVKKEQPKALINFKTFKNGVIILTTLGFALSFLKNSSYTKNSKLIKSVKNIGEFFKKKVYNPLAFKDFEISKNEFNQLTENLENIGCREIADGHRFIYEKYGKDAGNGIIKMYKSSLSDSKIPDIVKNVLESLKNEGANLSENDSKQIEKAIRTAIKQNGTGISENKFDTVVNKAKTILNNYKITLNDKQTLAFSNSIVSSLQSNITEKPIQVETKLKPFVDIITQPFKFVMSAMKLPFKITSSLVNIAVSPIEKKAAAAELGEAQLNKVEANIHKAVTEIFGEKAAKNGKISQTIFANAMEELQKKTTPYRAAKTVLDNLKKSGASAEEIEQAEKLVAKKEKQLSKYVYDAVEKSFNGVTQSSNKNTDLAMMSKLASSTVTSAFLVADNYNMVMLKSNGENKEEAKEKANERIIQRLSALFYQTLFINWFNSTFRSTYNSSLKGMTAVAIPNTLTTEILTRKSIGMPIGRKSLEELQEIDEKNEKRTGFAGKYFKFMRLLTGKKPLSAKNLKDKNTNKTDSTNLLKNKETTNLLEKFSK